MKKTIKFKKLVPEATIPTYAHDGDIGMDVKAVSVEWDEENGVWIYGTGLACETSGHMGVLGMMKSSIYKRSPAILTNAVGLIDSDQYRGEIKFIYRPLAKLQNSYVALGWISQPTTEAPYKVGDTIGQLVPLVFDEVDVEEADELSETERGTGGFGSTENLLK